MCLANNSERVTQIYLDSFDNEQIDNGAGNPHNMENEGIAPKIENQRIGYQKSNCNFH